MNVQNTRDFIKGINKHIDSNENGTITHKALKLYTEKFKNHDYYRIEINEQEYWLNFTNNRNNGSSFIHLSDDNRKRHSMIQFTLDSSNFKIEDNRFRLIQNRGITIGQKVKGMKEEFLQKMYEYGFNEQNVITENTIYHPNFNKILINIFDWILIRLRTKLELEKKYRNVDNYSNELEGWNDDEVKDKELKTEGGKKVVVSVRRERNESLRKKAIQYHGTICMACEFDFNEFYGEWAENYIEVHHVIPLSLYDERETNYKTDLSVLCANCHRMVHKRNDIVLSIEALKMKIRNAKTK